MQRRLSLHTLPVWFYIALILVVAAVTVGVLWLLGNIAQRQEESRQDVFRVAELTEDTVDPATWGQNFPRQYDSYRRTVDTERTRHGGSEAFQRLDEYPDWRTIFNGYAFSIDYREDRGHAYMLSDQRETERVEVVSQPGACLHCHAAVLPAYREKGLADGVPDDDIHREDAIMRGFEIVNSMPYTDAHLLVEHPITCMDCHDPETMQLRITRPAFLEGIHVLANTDEPLPHLPSIERWREEGAEGTYDPNVMANRQEMRSMVCAQCHVEYYFQGDEKRLTYPWHNGLKAEQMEAYYDDIEFKDWTHKNSEAPVLKAQHPEFELWSQGIHARSGVSCADCHMPYQREGAVKVSDHQVRSPLLNVADACLSCHNFDEDEMKARAEEIQDRTRALMSRAEDAVVALINDIEQAKSSGIAESRLEEAQDFQRKAQWRLDFIAAENSMGFHAPQESARILGEAIDLARQGQIALLKEGVETRACFACNSDTTLTEEENITE